MSRTDRDDVPNLPKYPVPILMLFRTYRSVPYRYESLPVPAVPVLISYHTYTEVSGTGIDVVPILPKCAVPVIPAVYIGWMPRYIISCAEQSRMWFS